MIELNKEYVFADFCKELEISNYVQRRRLDDLLEWLKEFYVYDFAKSRPYKITIHEILGNFEPLPRNLPLQKEATAKKKEDYAKFTYEALGDEYKPNSKSKIAREAIDDFGYKCYGHISKEAVTKRYIAEPFNKYGQTNDKWVWVNFYNYEPMPIEQVNRWKEILKEEHLSDEEIIRNFHARMRDEEIPPEETYYKKALDRIGDEFGIIPIYVQYWKRADNLDCPWTQEENA